MAVPALFSIPAQSDPSKPTDWNRIKNARATVKIVVALGDVNGLEQCGPTSCDVTAAQNQFISNHDAGQLVLGYINSQFATVTDVLGTSNGIGVNAWWSRYPTQIQGIFFDNGPSFDPSQSTLGERAFQDYYESKYGQVHGSPYGWQVMVNAAGFPGTPPCNPNNPGCTNGVSNTSQPQDWLLAGCSSCQSWGCGNCPASPGADYATIWEQTWGLYTDANFKATGPGGNLQAPPAWWTSAAYTNQGKLAHVVTGLDQTAWAACLNASRDSIHAPPPPASPPLVYLFDGTPRAYSRVPCYFEEEVLALNNQSHGEGKTWCSGACTDVETDSLNCGGCGFRCARTEACINATCTCVVQPCP
jgi:hypothetical protein